MSLLRDLESLLADKQASLETALLKARILASRLGSQDLDQWVQHELDGYQQGSEVPEYRIVGSHLLGEIRIPFGGSASNYPIPRSAVPPSASEYASAVTLYGSIAELEDMVSDNRTSVSFPWPAELVAIVSHKLCDPEGTQLVAVNMVVPVSIIRGVISKIRSKLLGFVLEIEKVAPQVGDASPTELSIPSERVQQVFNTNIMGGTVAIASQDFTQLSYTGIQPGDLESLKRFLVEAGVDPEDASELESAIKKDPAQVQPDQYGKRVSKWVARMMGKAAQGIWKISLSAAGQLIATALSKYYGLLD